MSSFAIKILAVVSMTIDHVGTAFFPNEHIFRILGRIAFPIYAFLCAQGASKTRNINKYLLRLGIFALISEVPFDLFLNGTVFSIWGQNVFFTLFFGVLAIKLYQKQGNYLPVLFCALAADVILSDYGWYGVALIFLLYLFNDNIKKQLIGFAAVTVIFLVSMWLMGGSSFAGIQLWCLAAAVPIYFYNGKKGFSSGRLLFYVYYPLHLLVISLISLNIIF